jgi:response regulator of citrate/malate metabolism
MYIDSNFIKQNEEYNILDSKTIEEILDLYEEAIRCSHYCPEECRHTNISRHTIRRYILENIGWK